MPTVLAGWTRLIVDYADAQRLPADAALAEARIARSALGRVDGRIPAGADDQLWETIARLDGRAHLGVDVSQRFMSARRLGVVGFLARASATVGEAIDVAGRYHRLIKEQSRIDVIAGRRAITIYEYPPPERGMWPAAVAEAVIANYVTLGRAWAGVDWSPEAVSFQHPRPRDTREHERFFGCPVRFSQPHNAIVVSREVLALPLRSAEPELIEYLRDYADARLEAVAAPRTLADDVRHAIVAVMAEGEVTVGQVAQRVGVSPRSLQRRLRDQGVSFRDLVDAVRRRRAVELLSEGRASMAEVAEHLGFSEPRAFRRAFRRWTGNAPSRFRVPSPDTGGASGPLPGA